MTIRCLLALLAFAVALSAESLTFVADGRSDYQIVLPDKSNILLDTAAEELQYHIEKASGARLPIVRQKSWKASSPAFVLGHGPKDGAIAYPKPNGFAVQRVGQDVYVFGDDHAAGFSRMTLATRYGTLFGVYEFLERSVGCRWLWPGELGEYIPKNATLTWDGVAFARKLPFEKNTFRISNLGSSTGKAWASEENRQRFNAATNRFYLRNRMVTSLYMNAGHAFTQYHKQYMKEHPDWFNLLPDGTRRTDPFYGSPKTIAMCVSNEGFQDSIVQRYLAQPNGFASCIENDTDGKCTCEKCMSWDAPDPAHPELFENRLQRAQEAFGKGDRRWASHLGSLSDRYAHFCNEVLAKARKHNPSARVLTYFYGNTRMPPYRTKLLPGVVGGVVPHLTFPWSDALRQEFRDMWEGWARAGAQMYLRPNYTLEGHNFPIWYADHFLDDFTFAAERGLIGTDFDAMTGQFATQGINIYAVVRAHYHFDLGRDAIIGEYTRAFGAAEQDIKQYFAHWKAISDAVDHCPAADYPELKYAGFAKFYISGPKIFPQSAFDRGFGILDCAASKVPSDSIEARRIAYLRHGLRNAELTMQVQAAKDTYGMSPQFIAKVQELDAYRGTIEHELGFNPAFLHFCENRTWDRVSIGLMSTAGAAFDASWKIWFDEKGEGESRQVFARDADASWSPIKVGVIYSGEPAHQAWKQTHGGKDFHGVCWYKAVFKAVPGKDAVITFGAVDEACKVYVNGRRLVDRPYPYKGDSHSWEKPFTVTVPAALLKEDNDITVKVINNAGPGGIYRAVFFRQ